jgi:hypothetical protein
MHEFLTSKKSLTTQTLVKRDLKETQANSVHKVESVYRGELVHKVHKVKSDHKVLRQAQ